MTKSGRVRRDIQHRFGRVKKSERSVRFSQKVSGEKIVTRPDPTDPVLPDGPYPTFSLELFDQSI